MLLLVLGLLCFFATHAVRIYGDGLRTRAIALGGPLTWKGLYSLVALLGLVLISDGYGAMRQDTTLLWTVPVGVRHPMTLLVLLAFILVAATYVPGNRIKRLVGHPMLAGVKLWAFAHLVVKGTLAGVVLFGSFLIWAVALYAVSRRRDRREGVQYPAGSLGGDITTVVVGVVAWAAFAFFGHLWLLGVAPFGQ
jgi:uncharacterized membrane protein